MTLPDTLDRIRAGVAALAARDPELRLFGASGHRYRLAPPVTEKKLSALEAAGGFRLPEDYREFLRTVGNGGAGPSYGVFPFRGKNSEDLTRYDRLGAPFAYTEPYNPTGLIGEEDEDDEDADPQRAYWDAFVSDGALYICHHGCASRSMLVVSGPCRGEVWEDETANDGGYFPARVGQAPDGPRHTFSSWYLAWLDAALASG